MSRSAAGVIVMRLGEDQQVVNFTKVAREEELEEELNQEDQTVEAVDVVEATDATTAE